jgi:hypothetical protein
VLGTVERLSVGYGAGAATTAWLYLAWLAARLGWRAAGPGLVAAADGGWTGRLRAPGDPARLVTVELRPGMGGGGLREVALLAPGPPALECRLARADAETVTGDVRLEGAPPERRRLREPEPDEATLIGRWLTRLRWDPLHAAALGALPALGPAAVPGGGGPAGPPAGRGPGGPDPGPARPL